MMINYYLFIFIIAVKWIVEQTRKLQQSCLKSIPGFTSWFVFPFELVTDRTLSVWTHSRDGVNHAVGDLVLSHVLHHIKLSCSLFGDDLVSDLLQLRVELLKQILKQQRQELKEHRNKVWFTKMGTKLSLTKAKLVHYLANTIHHHLFALTTEIITSTENRRRKKKRTANGWLHLQSFESQVSSFPDNLFLLTLSGFSPPSLSIILSQI